MIFIKFLFSRFFLVHLLLAGIVLVILIFVISLGLKYYTHFGNSVKVPDIKGIEIKKADEILKKTGLRLKIVDTVFMEGLPALSVAGQIPTAGNLVKQDRQIYITLNAIGAPEMVVPDVNGKSLRIATSLIENSGFRVGKIERKPDITSDVVLTMGISPGTHLRKGSEIPLTVSENEDEQVEVPLLRGLTLEEAIVILDTMGLNEFHIYDSDIKDSLEAIIYKTRPASGKVVNKGAVIDLFLRDDR